MNPRLKTKGFAVVHNPLGHDVTRDLKLPLYYTGLTDTALVSEQGDEPTRYKLDRAYNITIPLQTPPTATTWFLIE